MADYEYLNESGVIVPDTGDILADVQAEFQTAFGADLVLDPETPQGLLITAETLARASVARNNAALANQINPNIAGGVFLQAICALTGLDVPTATFSVIEDVLLTGQPTTVVPAGSQARTAANDIFMTISDVTLVDNGAGLGVALADFQAVVAGPVPAVIDALAFIMPGGVLGWETVLNHLNAAVLGTDAPSDAAIRTLRANTLALQGIGLPEAMISILNDTPGVRSLAFRENVTDATLVIDGISLVEHSVWVCVQGGTDADVALALLTGKSLGANWNGATTVNVVEASSGQTYPVKFQRPTETPVFVRVTIRPVTSLADAQASVKAAVVAYANGELSDEAGFTVGTDVSPFELAAAVNSQIPGVFVSKVEVSLDGTTWQTTELAIALDHVATTTSSAVTVVIL